MRDKVEEEAHQQQPPPPPSTTASPPSASNSPTHEFSFTISLHHQPPPYSTTSLPDKSKPPPSIAVDLSPADEIFFHGHLLPLHLLSHLPVSPRSSTNSLDNFTLPIRELLEDHHNPTITTTTNTNIPKQKPKSKSFSSFFGRRRKGFEFRDKEEKEKQKTRKLRFDVSDVLKRYLRMVRPLLTSLKGRRENIELRRQPYSFSGSLTPRERRDHEWRGKRGGNQFSAPASMRTSPTNSGLLVANGAVATSTSDSTMEELQAAIQAAIAHCKNSIAKSNAN